MKRMTFLLLTTLAFLPSILSAQSLSPGDIAFVMYNTDGNDDWAFITLTDISSGTTIKFTDLGWNDSTFYSLASESEITVTITSTITAGTVVTVSGTTFTPNIGTVSITGANLTKLSLFAGDQILCYQGSSTNPTFIAGISGDFNISDYDSISGWNTGASDNTTSSALPSGLTDSVHAISFFPGVTEQDNARYNCTLTTGTRVELLAAINNPANWVSDNSTPYASPCTTTPFTINPPVSNVIASISSQVNVACNGESTGSLTATATDGTPNFSYTWSNGSTTTNTSSTTNTISGLAAGTYTVTITDANSNTSTASATITEPVALTANTAVDSNATCNGSADGGATAAATGGVTPYTYLWNNGATTSAITGVSAGTYSVTVTDANGCTATSSSGIIASDNEAPLALAKNITVQLNANGQASITANDVDNGSSDNCGIAELSIDVSSFDCNDVGFVQGVTVVSDSSWNKSTVVNTNNSLTFPWTGAQTIPADSTFTDSVEVGQPYSWVSIVPIPGSETIRALNDVTFYRKIFNLSSIADLSARVRMRVDDDMEIYINGNLLAGEYSFSTDNFGGAAHDLKFEQGGNIVNGNNGGDQFDFVTSDTLANIFQTGTNEVILAIRNTINNDRGGFTFRMDVGIGDPGVPVTLTVKDSSNNISTAEALVVVEDNVAPVLNNMPNDKTVTSSDSSTVVYWTPPTPSDACGVQSLTKTNHPGDSFPYGTTAVIYTATDVNGNAVSDSFNITVVPPGARITQSSENGSGDDNQPSVVLLEGISEKPADNRQSEINITLVEVYPNPADDEVFISIVNGSKNTDLTLFTATGQLVYQEQLHNTNNTSIDVSQLKAGIYILKIIADGQPETRRLIIQ